MALLGDEGLADLAAFFRANRNVLQVGIGRGEPAGRRTGHLVGGVHAAGLGVELAHQGVGVGALELGDLAMLHDLDGQRMTLGREVLQDADVGRPRAVLVAPAARQILLVEQDLAQLLGRADIEGTAGELVQFLLELEHPLLELGRQRAKPRRIDLDAGLLHAEQHRDERPLDGLVHGDHVLVRQPGLELGPQLHGDVGVLGGVVARLVDRHLVEAHLLGPAAGHV